MGTILTNTKNSKNNVPHKFGLTLTDKLNLKDPNKHMALANFLYCFVINTIIHQFKTIFFHFKHHFFNIQKFLIKIILQLKKIKVIIKNDHMLQIIHTEG